MRNDALHHFPNRQVPFTPRETLPPTPTEGDSDGDDDARRAGVGADVAAAAPSQLLPPPLLGHPAVVTLRSPPSRA